MYATARASSEFPDLRTAAGDLWVEVTDSALAAISDSVSPAGVVAVCEFLDRPLERVLTDSGLITICADVRDPGNAGTLLRSSDAAGADGVVFAGRAVDVYNPKCVRASVGSLFHVPVATDVTVEAAILAAREAGLVVLAADGDGEVALEPDLELLRMPTAWIFGNEAWGLPRELAELADARVRIPIYGRAESLNVGAAATLCLYASASAHRSAAAD